MRCGLVKHGEEDVSADGQPGPRTATGRKDPKVLLVDSRLAVGAESVRCQQQWHTMECSRMCLNYSQYQSCPEKCWQAHKIVFALGLTPKSLVVPTRATSNPRQPRAGRWSCTAHLSSSLIFLLGGTYPFFLAQLTCTCMQQELLRSTNPQSCVPFW